MSDRSILKFNINSKPRRSTAPPHKIYMYDKMDTAALHQGINSFAKDFFSSCSMSSVEANWLFFKSSNLSLVVENSVLTKMSKSNLSLPWVSRTIKCQMRKRDRLLCKAKHSNDKHSIVWTSYRKQRNKVVKSLKEAHNSYLNNHYYVIGDSLQSNLKKFWSYVKRSRCENFGIPTLCVNDSIFVNDVDKAKVLNQQFQSVFTEDNGQVPILTPSSTSLINDIIFIEPGIRKQLQQSNPSKSPGPDGLSPKILCEFHL